MEEVWQRVTRRPEEPEPPESGEAPFLRGAIENASRLEKLYETMAKRVRNRPEGRALLTMLSHAREARRALERRYFILTGSNFRPDTPPTQDFGFSALLREAIVREERAERDFTLAAKGAEGRRAREFRRLADMARAHGEALEAMLKRLMR